MPVFQTSRLSAREMSLDDLDFIATLLSDAEVMRFYPKCYSRVESQSWIERQLQRYSEHGHGLWLISERETSIPVGQVGVLLQLVDNQIEPEVGYLIHRPYWRRGYATEAARAARDYAFTVLDHAYVISLIRPENLPSQGVAQKLGMKSERTTTFHGLDHTVFSVSRGLA
jgi:[ribosomal protein S5]-alanine N-acetyltransferase